MNKCSCTKTSHPTKLIVITGGPGAGKTAALEVAKKHFCEHVIMMPEAATILFQGGFFRKNTFSSKCATQRAIFHIQRELETVILEEGVAALGVCDRATIDGLAYWPGKEEDYWKAVGSTLKAELAKYTAVIHLRTPSLIQGYNHQNPVRTENALEASIIDEKIALIWQSHPKVFVIESETDFVNKVTRTLDIIRQFVPACCQE